MFLKLDTLSGRFVLVASVFVSILLVLGFTGHHIVVSAISDQFENIDQRTEANRFIKRCKASTRRLEIALQRYIILPNEEARAEILMVRKDSERFTQGLSNARWVKSHANLHRQTKLFLANMDILHKRMDEVIRVRGDHRLWVPAMVIMEDELLPANNAFAVALELALAEIEDGSYKESGQGVIVNQELLQISDAWTKIISEFRLLFANRFGVFSDNVPLAMKARTNNVEINASILEAGLMRLNNLDESNVLGFQGSVSLDYMREAYDIWRKSYAVAIIDLGSDTWRSDIPLLLNSIDPILKVIRSELGDIERELDKASADDIGLLTNLATQLRQFIWVLVLSGIALLFISYFVYQRYLLTPIEKVSRAMKAHASGNDQMAIPEFSLREISNLGDAFNEMKQRVHDRQQRLKTVLDNAAEAIITISDRGLIQSFNRAAELMFGFKEDEIIGKNISGIMPAEHRQAHDGYLQKYMRTGGSQLIGKDVEFVAQRQDGTEFPISLKVSETIINGEQLFTGIVSDITVRKSVLQDLEYRAERDPLTGLVNRALFQDRLDHSLRQSQRTDESISLLFLDLDGFKAINDELGHQAGDELLKEISDRLQSLVRTSDTVARLGGDEFTVIIEGADNIEDVIVVAQKILDTCAEPIILNGRERTVTVSLGLASSPEDAMTSKELIDCADAAMYEAKRAGKNQFHRFSKDHEKK